MLAYVLVKLVLDTHRTTVRQHFSVGVNLQIFRVVLSTTFVNGDRESRLVLVQSLSFCTPEVTGNTNLM